MVLHVLNCTSWYLFVSYNIYTWYYTNLQIHESSDGSVAVYCKSMNDEILWPYMSKQDKRKDTVNK